MAESRADRKGAGVSYRNEWEAHTPTIANEFAIGALPTPEKSDQVTPEQLTIWMKELKHGRRYSDTAVAAVVTAWRTGTLPWGSVWHGLPLAVKGAPPSGPGPVIGAGLFKANAVVLVGLAAVWWFLSRGKRV